MNARSLLGRAGEDLAARHYRRLGYKVVERNHRRPGGEIDLVLRRGRLLVFCEVKTRSSDRWGVPAEAVNPIKQARLRRLAAGWMSDNRPGPVDVRFDVVSAMVRGSGIEIEHIPDAF
jgi:putative endonuclease